MSYSYPPILCENRTIYGDDILRAAQAIDAANDAEWAFLDEADYMMSDESILETEDPGDCSVCGGENTILGVLGRRLHLRCRYCGMESSREV